MQNSARFALLETACALRPSFHPRRIGRRVFTVSQCSSTNDLALGETGNSSGGDGDVFLADFQTAGRGRLGRSWLSPRGGSVLCSVRLIEPFDAGRLARFSVAAAIAVHEAIRESTGIAAVLKWPNDVLIRGYKVAGILIETRPAGTDSRIVALGIGINCLQHRGHFAANPGIHATSLELEATGPVDRLAVAHNLISSLDRWLAPDRLDDPEILKDAWCQRSHTIGSRIRLRCPAGEFAGHVLDLDPSAGILVALDLGVRKFFCPLTSSPLD